MDLYFSPLACSMATRIALYEGRRQRPTYWEVDPKTKRVAAGRFLIFYAVNSLGPGADAAHRRRRKSSPRNAAILQYVADRFSRCRHCLRWKALSAAGCISGCASIGTELHKGPVRAAAGENGTGGDEGLHLWKEGLSRLDYLNRYLEDREFLLDHFSVRRRLSGHGDQLDHGNAADRSGEVACHQGLLRAHPQAAAASPRPIGEEFELYRAELARHKAGSVEVESREALARPTPPPSSPGSLTGRSSVPELRSLNMCALEY